MPSTKPKFDHLKAADRYARRTFKLTQNGGYNERFKGS
jgi:hypothetical protein